MRTNLVLIAAALAVALVSADGCTHLCKNTDINQVPGCDLQADACKCLFSHNYYIRATDPTTGAVGRSSWTSSGTLSGEEAIQNLFLTDNGCNCHAKSFPLGNCTANIKACFYWTSVGALQANQTSFRLFGQLTAPNPSPVYTGVAANVSDIEAASLALIGQMIFFDPACRPGADVQAAAVRAALPELRRYH